MTHTKRGLGWVRDLPDFRDLPLQLVSNELLDQPTSSDLRDLLPRIWDQGEIGSCTGQACSAAVAYCLAYHKMQLFIPSRLFIYFNARVAEQTIQSDSGARLRTCIKTLHKYGVCPEPEWPYLQGKFAERPPTLCYTHAAEHQILKYEKVSQTTWHIRAVLNRGFPIVFGFSVYDSFYHTGADGVVSLPQYSENLHGGHAVVIVGHNDEKRLFTCRNSWGDSWGQNGYFYMPYAYVTDPNLAADFWTITLTEDHKHDELSKRT